MTYWLLACAPQTTSAPGTSETTSPADTSDSASSTADTSTADTSSNDLECGPDVQRLSYTLCLETTGELEPQGSPYEYTLQSSGVLTEMGALEAWPGSQPTPLGACGPSWLQQVRWLDAQGATWTLGWDLSGPVDDGSTLALLPGAQLTLLLERHYTWYLDEDDLLLSDQGGPLLLIESWRSLTDEQRGGVSVEFPEEHCDRLEQNASWGYLPVSFASDDGALELWPSQSDTLGAMRWALGDRSLLDPCPSDWCGQAWWAAWRLP
jgi:hypothetical protein